MEPVKVLAFDGIEVECEHSGMVYRVPKGEYEKISLFKYAYTCPRCNRIHTVSRNKITFVKSYRHLTNVKKEN